MDTTPTITLTHKQFLQADRDYRQTARIAHLVYVSDSLPGISRRKSGKGYSYLLENKPLRDKTAIERIRRLVIPPSWKSVWICPSPNGHIQATGLDIRGRKQYRYHSGWNALRNDTKFHRLYEFGKALPAIRAKMEADFRHKELTRDKVLAIMISLMERTYIRVGNNEYEKIYGSYGLTTLKNKHVSITGDKILFSFRGKKGIHHDITLRSRKLARAVTQCREIPGKELFQYYAEDGIKKGIDSGMVNEYIRQAGGMDFSAKDFRTWAGSLHALEAFKSLGEAADEICCKKNLVVVLDRVSGQLGNSRAVCRKYYVHPALIRLYEENKLIKQIAEFAVGENHHGLSVEEEVLMKILKQSL